VYFKLLFFPHFIAKSTKVEIFAKLRMENPFMDAVSIKIYWAVSKKGYFKDFGVV